MSAFWKRFSAGPLSPPPPHSNLPDLLLVMAKSKTVSHDDYAALHSTATRLEERCHELEQQLAQVPGAGREAVLVQRPSREVADLKEALQVRDRMLKISLATVVLALFLPGLLSVLFSLAIVALLGFYFLDVHPVRSQIDNVFQELAKLFATASSKDAIAAAQRQVKRM